MQADESSAGFLEDLRVLEDGLQVEGVEAVIHECAESYRRQYRPDPPVTDEAKLQEIAAAARDTPLVPPTDRDVDGGVVHTDLEGVRGDERRVLERRAQAWMRRILTS